MVPSPRTWPLRPHTRALDWPGPTAIVVPHPAHAPGAAALLLPDVGVLVAGDMLSDVEPPLPDGDSRAAVEAYVAGLHVLEAVVQESVVRLLIPGHGHIGSTAQEIAARIERDRSWLRDTWSR